MPNGYLVGPDLLGRIRRTVDRVENIPYGYTFKKNEVRLDGDDLRPSGSLFRLGEISGSWLKGATKTLIRLDETGNHVSPQEQFEAKNFFADITVDCGTRKVLCVRVGSSWIMAQAEC